MILMICSDLFFASKIQETAKQLGIEIEPAHTISEALELIAKKNPKKAIVDVNDARVSPIELIQKIRAIHPSLEAIGFLSHVQTELKEKAIKAGFSKVVARSEFSKNLSLYLKG